MHWIWIGAWIAGTVILILVLKGGFASTQSGLQMGWVESNTRDQWSATYSFHDGYVQRVINSDGDPAILNVEIVSASGEIGMTITDEDGNLIFNQQGIETSSFQVEIPGRVTVKITGEDHRGSYSLNWN